MIYEIINGNNIDVLKTFPDNHFDSIITDPPYGIDFLGKAWDANTGALETYQQCLRVLKPGGHILAFSAARTYHHLAVTLEQAGFEIRDQIMWIYSSGFPKSQDVGRQLHKKAHGKPDKQRFNKDEMEQHYSPGGGSNGFGRLAFSETEPAKNAQTTLWRHKQNGKIYKALPDINADRLAVSHEGSKYGTVYEEIIEVDSEWSGWGSALKPAHEPIALARKPIKLSIARNCQTHGVGALNIDACRVPFADENDQPSGGENGWSRVGFSETPVEKYCNQKSTKPKPGKMGTTAHDNYNAEKNADQGLREGEQLPWTPSDAGRFPANVIGDIAEPYQKYFYCPKVSRAERHVGFDDDTTMNKQQWLDLVGGKWCNEDGSMGEASKDGAKMCFIPGKGKIYVHGLRHEVEEILRSQGREAEIPEVKGNNHPTVKPIELMKYLIKLITPPGGIVLDPFNGSGSTGCAAEELGFEYIGCELDPAYVEITKKRIEAWTAKDSLDNNFEELFIAA